MSGQNKTGISPEELPEEEELLEYPDEELELDELPELPEDEPPEDDPLDDP